MNEKLEERVQTYLGVPVGSALFFVSALIYCKSWSWFMGIDLVSVITVADYFKIALTWFSSRLEDIALVVFVVSLAWLWAHGHRKGKSSESILKSKYRLMAFIALWTLPGMFLVVFFWCRCAAMADFRAVGTLVLLFCCFVALWIVDRSPKADRRANVYLCIAPLVAWLAVLSGMDDAMSASNRRAPSRLHASLADRSIRGSGEVRVYFVLEEWFVVSTDEEPNAHFIPKGAVSEIFH